MTFNITYTVRDYVFPALYPEPEDHYLKVNEWPKYGWAGGWMPIEAKDQESALAIARKVLGTKASIQIV
jgi:hypothetical protein